LRRPHVQLLIVGDGPGRAALEARAGHQGLSGRCHLTGPVPNAEIPRYLAAFDIATAPYLDPGVAEGFYFSPLKVLEAMAAARPLVASRFDSIEELLGGTGRLVPSGDPVRLAAALEELLEHPERARVLGDAARARAIAGYSWSAVAARIMAAASLGNPAGSAAPARSVGEGKSR
jgi:glycosyltransferase involved in cell wall biosynthesis